MRRAVPSQLVSTVVFSVISGMHIPFVINLIVAISYRGLASILNEGGIIRGYRFLMLFQFDLATCFAVILSLLLLRLRSGWAWAIAASIVAYGFISCFIMTARSMGVFIWWRD